MPAHTFHCNQCSALTPAGMVMLAGVELVVRGPDAPICGDLRFNRIRPAAGGGWLSEHMVPMDAPKVAPCRVCGADAVRVISRSRFNLIADGSQRFGWSRPGWCDIDYKAARARHLRGPSGETLNMSQDPDDNPGIRMVNSGRRAARNPTSVAI